MLKKIPLDKINGTNKASFFLSPTRTYHNFTFNLQFLYECKRKVHSISFLLKFVLLFNKMHGLFDFKTS